MRRLLIALLAAASLSLAACTPGERVVGAAAVGAVTGAVVMTAVNDAHYGNHWGHRPPPPRHHYSGRY